MTDKNKKNVEKGKLKKNSGGATESILAANEKVVSTRDLKNVRGGRNT